MMQYAEENYDSDKHTRYVLCALLRIPSASWFVLCAWKCVGFGCELLLFWASAPCRGSVLRRSSRTFSLHLQGGWIVSNWMLKWQGRRKCGGYTQRFEGFTTVTDAEGGRRGYDCPEPKGTKIFSYPEDFRNVKNLTTTWHRNPK